LKIRLLRGAGFVRSDSGQDVVVLNQTLARRLFGSGDPVGQLVEIDGGHQLHRVVGVAADSRWRSLDQDPGPFVYRPLALNHPPAGAARSGAARRRRRRPGPRGSGARDTGHPESPLRRRCARPGCVRRGGGGARLGGARRELATGANGHPGGSGEGPEVRMIGAETFVTLPAFGGELSLALRRLARSPRFALAVVLSLALGIGTDVTMLGLVDSLLFRPPVHVRDVDRLVDIRLRTYPDYVDLRDQTRSFSGVAGWWAPPRPYAITDGDRVLPVQQMLASASLFPVLGVQPALGRFYTAAEDRPGGPHLAVLGYGLWRR